MSSWTTTATSGDPGEFPYTRGIHRRHVRRPAVVDPPVRGLRHAPRRPTERFRFLLAQGQAGALGRRSICRRRWASTPTTRARWARSAGWASRSTRSRHGALFDGSRWTQVSTSMTINAPAPVLVAMYHVAGELQGRDRVDDPRDGPERRAEGVRRARHLHLPAARRRCASRPISSPGAPTEAPRFNAISLSGYHMREAGCTAAQEMGFAVANAIAYIDAVLAQGVAVDDFAPRLSWIFNTHTHFFEEIAKYRALRRMWATIMRDRFGARDPRSLQLRTHTQTGGSTLTLQQPENNIVRAALQALAAVLGGVQSLALSCFDEAIAIPTEHAQTLAVRTQQILAARNRRHRHGRSARRLVVRRVADRPSSRPRRWRCWPRSSEIGGAVAAVETGFYQRAIDDEAYAPSWRSSGRARRGRRQPLPRGRRSPARVLRGRSRAGPRPAARAWPRCARPRRRRRRGGARRAARRLRAAATVN